jgi:two-component system nitrogen regulation sensor histidine kinase NtrY
MTQQLARQRSELVDANSQIDERRRFTEAVLGGVSAGVIGLDANGRINLPNRAASNLLGVDLDAAIDLPLADVVPRMAELVDAAQRRPHQVTELQLELQRDAQRISVFSRITVEWDEARITGYVVTFDDITDLLSAQRKAAWSDIARRIAHEIKNPLTPIQLSAERLRSKYLQQISTDADIFESLTNTIVRQVGDIGRMVDEFSDFARMPAPVFSDENLCALVRQQLALQQTAHPEISLVQHFPDLPVDLVCDSGLVRQALTNLLQNAVDAIESHGSQGGDGVVGKIVVSVMSQDDNVVVEVADNGLGLPEGLRHRLTEPYVTTREKGTGLGLAIVTKIMEDHDGIVELLDRDGGGARARLVFSGADTMTAADGDGHRAAE